MFDRLMMAVVLTFSVSLLAGMHRSHSWPAIGIDSPMTLAVVENGGSLRDRISHPTYVFARRYRSMEAKSH